MHAIMFGAPNGYDPAKAQGKWQEQSQSQVPPGGYDDNPMEVNQMLSQEYFLKVNHTDLRNLAFAQENGNNRNSREKDIHSKVDDLLHKQMMQMSLGDRNAIVEEMHGVQNLAPEESFEMINSALRDLASEISVIPPQSRQGFDRSRILAPNGYISSAEFKLRFLRCEFFDAKRAASRMIQFVDLLAELFGDDVLRRPILLKDFSKEEIQVFRLGHQQLLPYRDRSGRRIFALVGGIGITVPLVTRVKILIYIMLAASDDVESQRKGLISIIWPGTNIPSDDKPSNFKLNRIMFMKRVYGNLPIRSCSIHFCSPNTGVRSTPFFRVLRTLIILTMPQFLNRMKFHTGHPIELLYCVKAFGIPVDLIPLTDTGNIKTTYLKQWMNLRRSMDDVRESGENVNKVVNFSECPGSNDVVFRTGTSMYCHPGNVHFRCLMQEKHEILSLNFQKSRAELAGQIIAEIEAKGGKFLRWDKQGQYLTAIEQSQIHSKVILAIRDFKYKNKIKRVNLQMKHDRSFLFLPERNYEGTQNCSVTQFCRMSDN